MPVAPLPSAALPLRHPLFPPFLASINGMIGPARASAQPVGPPAGRRTARRPGVRWSDCGGRDRGGCDQPTRGTRRPGRPTSHAVENALRTGVLGSVCAYGRRPALSPAWGRRPAVWGRTHEAPGARLLHPLYPAGGRIEHPAADNECARVHQQLSPRANRAQKTKFTFSFHGRHYFAISACV